MDPQPETTMPLQPMPEQAPSAVYPTVHIDRIQNPNRLYAVPILGWVIKVIILIPVFFMLFIYGLACGFSQLINPFFVLFKGQYWDTAYKYTIGYMRYMTKMSFFLYGLTDKYPGFGMDIKDNFSVDMPKPESPNRLYAVPLLGIVIRGILLIPYAIFKYVVQYGAMVGVVISSFPVLFTGKYPEATYELARDFVRVNLGMLSYTSGLSDKYPSFWISMNHKTTKIVLLVVGAILFLFYTLGQVASGAMSPKYDTQYNSDYEQQIQNQINQQLLERQMEDYTEYNVDEYLPAN